MDFQLIPLNAFWHVTDSEGEYSSFLQLIWLNTLIKCSLEEERFTCFPVSTSRSIMKTIEDEKLKQEHRPRNHRGMLLVKSPLADF